MKRHSLCVTNVLNGRCSVSLMHEAPDREIHNVENFLRNLNSVERKNSSNNFKHLM